MIDLVWPKAIAQMTEIQDGYDEGSEEWQAYDDMLEAILGMWAHRPTHTTT